MITNPLDKLPDILKKDLDENLCVCNEVPKRVIINAIAEGALTLEEVQRKTYASDGNGCCKRQVNRLLECLVSESVASDA
ncbi:BFD-like (2Fe-2S)-binding protein [Hydrogenovibrio crunogenus]|uniref:BFD-like (2Fe-2S)-binding protein n=1 Tax=Hydrogenovibrio crunogenus TaxID=39765 RepID=A0A4P7NZ60_9GAMM|nr:(2Fe-2S)-binding protein [Hydrogenovibrio crunogenus]QBZ82879.1 BFD-like (2Fe-2S)-binding protein [Hydrogenovibrio crunogenus]